MNKRKFLIYICLLLTVTALSWGVDQGQAAPTLNPAVDLSKPNFAYSPTNIQKFVDLLPGINAPNALGQQLPLATADKTTFPGCDYYEIALVEYREQMHTNLPAVTGVWPAVQTGGAKLWGYVQEVNGVHVTVPHYLGPLILATKDRPVRIKFTNRLSQGANLFVPRDSTIMGAGMGPLTTAGAPCDPNVGGCASYTDNRAAIHLHGGIPPWISDGTPHQWITPASEVGHTPFIKGVSQHNVPDMWYDSTSKNVIAGCAGQLMCATANATIDPAGVATYYWTNQQSGRLMFYHDHALGITRLTVYAGQAAGYLVVDPAEETALATAGVPGTIVTNSTTGAIVSEDLAHLIPLVIQDKTFVPANVLTTDPLWDTANWGGTGNLWFPHVYQPNQDPTDLSGANPLGRWDYGPWFWPVFPVASPYPPTVSHVPEAFMDTPMVNGTAYPYLTVAPAKYRLRILNASNDRMLNLQLYQADTGYTTPATATATVSGGVVTGITLNNAGSGYAPNSSPMVHIVGGGGYGAWATATVIGSGQVASLTLTNGGAGYITAPTVTIGGSTEVKMVPAVPNTAIPFPDLWKSQTPGMIPDILDSRLSGVPDPRLRGPAMIQIGTEGGLLPGHVVLYNTPVGFEQNKRNIVVLNVLEKTLFMAPAERADVIVDFTNFAGKTIILYNDSPAPVPAGDPRYDFYTGNPDYSATGGTNNQGGAPSTIPGYGPNTRTIMQFRVTGSGGTAPVDDVPGALVTSLTTALPAIFKASQDVPVVPESAYNAVGYGAATDTFARIQDLSLTFTPYGSTIPITKAMKNPTIQELFDAQGRMNATLGVELPFTGALIQTTVPLGYIDPTTEILKAGETQLWKITHNGVDTHVIHFHLVNVQVINRVGWDGAIRTTDPNELGWKESIRMNPLEDCIVAMRARIPTYPFSVPNSIRLLNPAMPEGSTFASLSPLDGAPITVTNAMTNFGHEYVWHCHILGHEENDMMRPLVLNVDQLLYVANAGTGIWQWELGTWSLVNAAVPASMVASGSNLYASVSGSGLYQWNGTAWSQINTIVPASMVASGSMLYADFAGYGLYSWSGTAWTQINTVHPASMLASGSLLYADFAGYGLYSWNGTAWTQINTVHPASMVASGSLLYADFAGYGLYSWNGTAWTQINTVHPASMVASGSLLYADFAGYGLYSWNGTAWTQINTVHPASMVAAGSTLYATFTGYSNLYSWNGSAWSQINNVLPTSMVASGSVLYADFSGYGLYKWEGTAWSQLNPTDPTIMVAGF
jgi:FtsP/CotA-like multicopper oxidase with cupredoxin domain